VAEDIVKRLETELDDPQGHIVISTTVDADLLRDAADEIVRLRNRLQACQSTDALPLTDDCITQNERFFLAENERLRAERDAERAEVERLRRWKAEATTLLKDGDCWAEQGIALLDAINALHHPVPSGKGDEVCTACASFWPCRTHLLLHPEEGPS